MDLIQPDECVHVIERRLFPGDVRRHFIGQVEAVSERAIRVRGYLFVYDSSSNAFVKKPEPRTRIFPLDNRVIVNMLPASLKFENIGYFHDSEGNLSITDGAGFELDISEFSPKD
jgi:hypothetical protein